MTVKIEGGEDCKLGVAKCPTPPVRVSSWERSHSHIFLNLLGDLSQPRLTSTTNI